jgi:aryl-alcohol dehydrogenase-like predicted oxidoreductase
MSLTEELIELASASNRVLPELALPWLLSRPGVTSVVVGATNPDQLSRNIAASEHSLTPEDLTALDLAVARHDASIQTWTTGQS